MVLNALAGGEGGEGGVRAIERLAGRGRGEALLKALHTVTSAEAAKVLDVLLSLDGNGRATAAAVLEELLRAHEKLKKSLLEVNSPLQPCTPSIRTLCCIP